MKLFKSRKIISIFMVLCFLWSASFGVGKQDNGLMPQKEMRGVWVSTVLNLDYPTSPTDDGAQLKKEAVEILDDMKQMGLNTVFLQVRPAGDALYPSAYFPWSQYLTGSQGKAPKDHFDPLQFWIDEAHQRGIALHAWINPYRLSKKTKNDKAHDLSSLDDLSPVKAHPEWVVSHGDGNFYLDPGLPQVRDFIVESVNEILARYAVDGIHMDDYFYPEGEFDDKTTFQRYGGSLNLSDFRRENVNLLIQALQKAVHQKDPTLSFGVSPFGIWANKQNYKTGSETRGLESFSAHYADSKKWVKEGWVDYIAPQIYWHMGFDIADYEVLTKWWINVVKDTNVKLYIGQAAYRMGNKNFENPWYGTAEMERQLKYNRSLPEIDGSIFFRVQSLRKNQNIFTFLMKWYQDNPDVFLNSFNQNLWIGRPDSDVRTGYQNYYISGVSNPKKPLYLNGKEIKDRSASGYFGVYVDLKKGENTFTFSQGKEVKKVNIYCTAGMGPSISSKVTLEEKYLFPQAPSYWQPGEQVTLSCRAPIGSMVKVILDGKSYEMKPRNTKRPAKGVAYTEYRVTYTIPSFGGVAQKKSIGKPQYQMGFGKHKIQKEAPFEIGCIMKGTPLYAVVQRDGAETHDIANRRDGSRYELFRGMKDLVTAISGDYSRLSSDQWVKNEDIRLEESQFIAKNYIEQIQYEKGEKYDRLDFIGAKAFQTMTLLEMKENELLLTLPYTDGTAQPLLPGDGKVASFSQDFSKEGLTYRIALKDKESISGFFAEQSENKISLFLKAPIQIKDFKKPLSGIRILLDPGHGARDTGALGPLGPRYAEKHINLDIAFKLEQYLKDLGAEVAMTRREDVYLSLQDRLAISREQKPDLFVSVHANSMNPNVNISKIDGFCAFYREPFGEGVVQNMLSHMTGSLGLSNKGMQKRNFYVMRGTWAISVLFEAGFVPNPRDFEWLSDGVAQDRFAKQMAQSIQDYFVRSSLK